MKRLLLAAALIASPLPAQTIDVQTMLAPDVFSSIELCKIDVLYHFIGKCPSGWVLSPSLAGAAYVDDGSDISLALQPSWGSGKIPASAAPDVVGAFRFICSGGQVLPDDPIVYPGQPGKSHLHQFYGNEGANAYSTYASLRKSGISGCNRGVANPANRSAYWMPAMLSNGQPIKPAFVAIYYKRMPISNPKCTIGNFQAMGNCLPLPNGLRFIFGYDMLTGKSPTGSLWFNCQNGKTGVGAKGGHYLTLAEAAPNCPAGTQLGAVIEAPNCWDGKNLDSPNHRDHMAYPSYGTWGYKKCDSGHPYVIPGFTLGAWYTVPAAGVMSLSLSSDAMFPNLPKGTTFHADWFGAWNQTVLNMWTDNCINKMLNCSGGDLGNGEQLKGAQ